MEEMRFEFHTIYRDRKSGKPTQVSWNRKDGMGQLQFNVKWLEETDTSILRGKELVLTGVEFAPPKRKRRSSEDLKAEIDRRIARMTDEERAEYIAQFSKAEVT